MASYGASDPMGSMGVTSDEHYAEFDGNFEPFARGRANTWHAGLFYQDEVSLSIRSKKILVSQNIVTMHK